MNRLISVLMGLLLIVAASHAAGGKIDRRLSHLLESLTAGERTIVWVYFADKGTHEALRQTVPPDVVSERSLQRRAKVRPIGALVDYTDLPVEQSYVQRVSQCASGFRQQSKWLNGVSVVATEAQIRDIEALPFVRSIELVARSRRSPGEVEVPSDAISPPHIDGTTSFNYGASFSQVNQMAVPAVHDRNNYAQGVVVGVFDNGFRLLNHEVFDTLRPRIIATYDFVDHKVSVTPNNPDPGVGAHGVNTLSTIGGFKSGQLIGPAFGATYILARTENDSSETPFEEDNWVAAIEWADSIGVDVTSTSLGYLTYDPPYTSWTWEDMDGNTTAITRAADMAVGRGILVVNSAGNEGSNASHNTLGAPADGDSVFTIGAVTSTGTRSSFSSVGPTTSTPPRIKPDVMAQGSTVRVASATNPTAYGTSQGTSFSCPLAAGVAALMIHARPTDSPVEIMNTLRSTASRAGAPDNQYGWGILNALAALAPSGVILLSPGDAAVEQDTALTLRWTGSRWATAYRLQVASGPSFTTLILDDTTVTDSSRQVTGLLPGATYYWRVAARNVYGSSPFSTGWSFTTSATPPPTPILLAPVDGAVNIQTATTLAWNPTARATSYQVQIGADSAFSVIVHDQSSLTTTSTSVTGLSYLTEYFWHTRAANGAGMSPFSQAWRFTTVPPPLAPPLLVSPADSATGLPLTVTLLWNRSEGAVTYHALLSTDPEFLTTVVDDSTLTDTTLSVGPLQAGVVYHWKVRAKTPGGPGAWPTHRQFTTEAAVVRTYALGEGWNLLALPLRVSDPTMTAVFPTAISQAFHFVPQSGYAVEESLSVGEGYWVKFDAPDSTVLAGQVVLRDTIGVSAGWNLIGGISDPIDTALAVTLPPSIRVSGFYEYLSGYGIAAILEPGRGYWVKTNQSGLLILEGVRSAIRRGKIPLPSR